MITTVSHRTTYLYSGQASICHTQAHLTPANTPWHRLLSHELTVVPEPAIVTSRNDYFGNQVTSFSIHEPHRALTITASSTVESLPFEVPHGAFTPPWEQVRDAVFSASDEEHLRASEFVFRSPLVTTRPEYADYAKLSFTPGRPVLEAALDLCHRIHVDFHYDPGSTTPSTPVEEVFRSRKGVCQDFAHFMIACLRSLGLAARYVSGYLRSGERTRGAEASHAWCAVFCPGLEWLKFDPTNDLMPVENHVVVARGRDYSDVTPVRGVVIGGGEQMINVSVEVLPPMPTVPPSAGDKRA